MPTDKPNTNMRRRVTHHAIDRVAPMMGNDGMQFTHLRYFPDYIRATTPPDSNKLAVD
jgi:hypothetical protein